MAAFLTQNAILTLYNGDVDLQPVVQILDVRQLGTGQGVKERYRLILSDGVYVRPAFLCTQLNNFVKSGQIQRGSIVKLIKYICETVQNRKIILVLIMEVAVSEAEIIGDPIINADALPAPTASTLQQPPLTPAMQSPSTAPQPQLHCSSGSYGYKAGPGVGPSSKEALPPSYYSAAPKPAQPVGYASRVNAQASGGAGICSNRPSSTHCPPVTAPSCQPAPLYFDRGPILNNLAPARIVRIADLNRYQGRWTIKARVTAKMELQQYKNARGEGKFFKFSLLDAEGGEIYVTCFDNVADQFYDRTEVGKVYMISKGSLMPAQRPYNHLRSDWGIYLENTSTVEPCYEDDGSIPHQIFDFKPIMEIENMEADSMVDLIGVVVTMKPTTTVILRKNGRKTQKRSLQLLDISGWSVEVIMWGTFCNNEGQQLQDLCVSGQFPVLAFKAGRISSFSAKSVSTIPLSRLLVNPNLPQAFEVKEWFERLGKTAGFQSVGHRKSTVIKSNRLDFAAENRLLIDLGYSGPKPAGIAPMGSPGGKAMVDDHGVQAKSSQTQITTFFRPLIESSVMQSTPSKTMELCSEPCPLITKTTRKVALPKVIKAQAIRRPRLPSHQFRHPYQR